MKYKFNQVSRLVIAATVAGMTTGVQSQAVAQDESSASGIEEIIVTAQRREQSLLDVPIAVTAFTGADLERRGIQDIVELAKFTPNVTLEVSRGTNTTLTAFIRGVGQQDPVAGFEAGVGLYIDDVYLNRPQAAVLDIYDVERIEILRGPQGTLYGRNTIGGAIKYVTRRLGDEPEVKLRGSVGTETQLDFVVSASIPVSDTLKIGGSIASLNRDGFGDNLNIAGVENYNKQLLAGRISIEFTPSETLFFRLSGDIIDDRSDPKQGHRLTVGNVSGAPILDNVFDTRSGLNNPKQRVKAKGLAFTGEWQASDTITVKNILAYREDDSRTPIDFDSLPVADLDVPADYNNKQFSEELQVHYSSERLNGLVGFYYLDASAFTAFDVILAQLGDLIGLPGLNAFTLGDVDTKTWSVFGDFTYDVTNSISVALGGRYTEDERTSTILRQTFIGGTSARFGGTATAIATTSDFTGSQTSTKFTPRAVLSWKPSDDQTLYFSYSKGFKGGGFDPRGQSTAAPDLDGDGDIDDDDIFQFLSFEPETVDSFELGWKASLLDRRLNVSIAAFLGNYKNVQVPGSVGIDTTGDGNEDTFIGITSNAADADVNGIEFEGQALLSTDLTGAGDSVNFFWSLGYLDAKYNVFIDALGVDVADQRVFQNTPEWTLSGRLVYSRPWAIGGNDGSLSLISSLAYRSAASQFETPNDFLDQPGFTLWDASLVWEADDARWQVGIHGKNLTDERYKVAGYNFPALGLEGSVTAFFGNPRTVTATAEYRF